MIVVENTLQHAATCCNMLQHAATVDTCRCAKRTSSCDGKQSSTHCIALQHAATHCDSGHKCARTGHDVRDGELPLLTVKHCNTL